MITFHNDADYTDNAYNVPHISKQLADYLKGEFSADEHIKRGLLSDTNTIRTEGYLLGFLAGLGYARQQIDVMLMNQEAKVAEDDVEHITASYLHRG